MQSCTPDVRGSGSNFVAGAQSQTALHMHISTFVQHLYDGRLRHPTGSMESKPASQQTRSPTTPCHTGSTPATSAASAASHSQS
eukprot:351431-Chlamydomonas_euryale.AAC.3